MKLRAPLSLAAWFIRLCFDRGPNYCMDNKLYWTSFTEHYVCLYMHAHICYISLKVPRMFVVDSSHLKYILFNNTNRQHAQMTHFISSDRILTLNQNVFSKNPRPWQTSLRPCLKHRYIFQSFSLWTCPSGYPLHGMLGHTWDSHVTGVVWRPRACGCWWCTRPRPSASPCSPGAAPGGTARDPEGSYPVPPLKGAPGRATVGRTCCL